MYVFESSDVLLCFCDRFVAWIFVNVQWFMLSGVWRVYKLYSMTKKKGNEIMSNSK